MSSPTFLSRRRFLQSSKWVVAPAFLGSTGSYGYGALLERHRLTVEKHQVSLSLGTGAPQRLRAVSLTDFHFDPLYEVDFIAECVRQVNELKPDVVLLTGDYISDTSHRFSDFAEVIGGLKPACGVFACLGNHDQWGHSKPITEALRAQHIDVLRNHHTRVACNGGELILAGLGSAWAGKPDWAAAGRGVKAGERVLALMHEPDFANQLSTDSRVVMQFSGHTHGGQIRLPGVGALRLPSWGKQFQAGFYDVGNLKLYVNRGIGTIEHHVRLFCPPEIACFDITNADLA